MAAEEVLASLTLLESRLRTLEFLLTGSSDSSGVPEPITRPAKNDETVISRLRSLEGDLRRLVSTSVLAQDVLRLYTCFPDLFTDYSGTARLKLTDPATKASIVLAHASSFPETASRLSSLKDLAIPPAEASCKLVDLAPRLIKVAETQERQLRQITELRERSARVVEQWVREGVVGTSEGWAEWEARVREAEQGVRRLERRRREDEQ